MKRILVILLILLLVLGALFGFALYNLNSLIAQFKPTLEETISHAVGSKVTFSSIEASGFPNLKLELKDAAMSGGSEISAPKLFLEVALLPLLSKKIEVETISVEDAKIGGKSPSDTAIMENLLAKAKVKFENGDTAISSITASARVGSKEDLSLDGKDLSFQKDGTMGFGASTITNKGESFPVKGSYNVKSKAGDIKISTATFSGTLNIDLKTDAVSYSMDTSGSGLSASEVLRFANPSLKEVLTGTLSNLNSKLKGSFKGGVNSISGPFNLTLEKGELKGINLGGKVLGATKGIPLLDGALLANVNPKYQGYFASENTPITSLTADGSVGGGSVLLNSLVLVSDAYTLNSSGKAVFGGALDLKARIVFNKEVSEGIVGSIKELRKILTPDGTLEIPLELKGVPPSLTVIPDVGRLIELAAKGALREKAGEAIGKALEKQGIGKEAQKAIEGLFDF